MSWKQIRTIALSHLSAAELRAYVMTDSKLLLNAGWESDILAIELQAPVDLKCNFGPRICPSGRQDFRLVAIIWLPFFRSVLAAIPKIFIALLVLDLLRPR